MQADDELRSALVREHASRARPRTADAVLSELRPAMRRARRRRVAATTAAITVALGGLAAAAQVVRTDRSDTIRITSDDTPGAQDPDHTPVTEPHDPTPDRTPDVATVTTTRDDQPAGADDDGVIEPAVASPHRESPFDDSPDLTGTPTDDDSDRPLPRTAPPPTVPATIVAAAPTTVPTTVATTLPTPLPAPLPERFDSRCGYAVAMRTTESVDVVEIVPADGYDYRLEDHDHGGVTVQFTGGGEDCELKIGTAGSTSGSD